MVKAIRCRCRRRAARLLEPFGNFSPMGVLWYSVGSSFPYERFAGAMELTAAVLLFVPRLSMLGAMVLVADSVQIFTLNMTYDVPVKLFSLHLIVMGLVLLAPEMRRLTDVLILNRATGPSTLPPLARSVTMRRVLLAAQIVFGAYILGTSFVDARASWFSRGFGAPKPPLYGIWTVEKMTVDGVERAPLVTDWGRWRRVVVQNAATIAFWRMDDSFIGYSAVFDAAAKIVAHQRQQAVGSARWTYEQPTAGRSSSATISRPEDPPAETRPRRSQQAPARQPRLPLDSGVAVPPVVPPVRTHHAEDAERAENPAAR